MEQIRVIVMRRIQALLGREPGLAGVALSSSHMVLATVAGGALGYLYWIAAARLFAVPVVGEASALVSAMLLIAHVASLGVGLGLAYVLPKARDEWGTLIASLTAVIAAVAAVISVAFFMGKLLIGVRLGGGEMFVEMMALFTITATVWTLAAAFDQVMVIERRTSLHLLRNTLAAVIRLAGLPIALLLVSSESAFALYAGWGISALVTLVLVLIIFLRTADLPRPIRWAFDGGAVRRVMPLSIRSHGLATADSAPDLLLPIVILATLSSEANAYFYTAYMVVFTTIFTIPDSIARSLFAHRASDSAVTRSMVFSVLGMTMAVVVPLALAIIVARDLILMLFGPAYVANGSTLLLLLAAAAVPMGLISIYIGAQQIRRDFQRAYTVSMVRLAGTLGLAVLFIDLYGLLGVGIALIMVNAAVALACAVDFLLHSSRYEQPVGAVARASSKHPAKTLT